MTHGHSTSVAGNPSRTYYAWSAMKRRCSNPNAVQAKWYSEVDIGFDPSWGSFYVFLSDMGECPPGKELDRIDNSKNYSKDNCRWVSHADNMRNSTVAVLNVEKVKEIKCLLSNRPAGHGKYNWDAAIGERFGVSGACIMNIRLRRSWVEV